MKLFNLTLHRGVSVGDYEVEETPRLKPVADVSDWETIIENVRQATADIPDGSNVLVGGLGQYQAVVQEWARHHSCKIFFALFDKERGVAGYTSLPLIKRW